MITSFKIYCNESFPKDFNVGFDVDPEEGKYRLGVSEVYHWTGYKSLDDILIEDKMISLKYGYISFTVRKDFNFCNLPIRMVFDMECLKRKWKVIPFNYYKENIEREVKIPEGDISGIKECIKRVEIFETPLRDYDDDFIEYLIDYYPDIKFIKMGNWRSYEDSVEREVHTDGSIIVRESVKELERPDGNIPLFLYHATYRPYLNSIREFGLNPDKVKRKSWDFSERGVIYLDLDSENALSFAESSEDVPESYIDRIVILEIDTNRIDKSKLYYDRNTCYTFSLSQNKFVVKDENECTSFEYHGVISWDSIKSVYDVEKEKYI